MRMKINQEKLFFRKLYEIFVQKMWVIKFIQIIFKLKSLDREIFATFYSYKMEILQQILNYSKYSIKANFKIIANLKIMANFEIIVK